MDTNTFFRGFMYALLCNKTEEFSAEGEKFQKAFASMIKLAIEKFPEAPAKEILSHFDPVFGVYHEADLMLLEAEQDLVISLLNPKLKKARFKISEESAKRELQVLPKPDLFIELAKHFHEQLTG